LLTFEEGGRSKVIRTWEPNQNN